VAALVLIDVPLDFAAVPGAFSRLPGIDLPARAARPSAPQVPGSLLSMLSACAAPLTFCVSRYIDCVASMASWEHTVTHWRVERWTLDEFPMSRKLFDEVMEYLYRQNRFMRGELMIGAVRLHPRNVGAPLLSVYQLASTIIPSESVLAFHRAAGSSVKELVPYFGDTGVALQHVGPLVGDNAYRQIWPRVFRWLDRISKQSETATCKLRTGDHHLASWPGSSAGSAED
jgi:polyhydroxyalkanoate synthase